MIDSLVGRVTGRAARDPKLHSAVARDLHFVLEDTPVWVLTGELDDRPRPLLRELHPRPANLDVTVLEGRRLHAFRSPEVQDATRSCIAGWATRAIGA